MSAWRDFAVTSAIAVIPAWLVLGPGAIPFALGAGALVTWDNAKRRQARTTGGSMK